jgi:hypothetical protein
MIAGISPNGIYNPGMQRRIQQSLQDFQQLGQDLKSGNLPAAQNDFATLQQLDPLTAPASSTQGNPIAQAFGQLSQDLQSGNLPAAQQDFTTIQQDFQSRTGMAQHHHANGNGRNPLVQGFDQLLQMLQLGNQPGAQQAYTSLGQSLQQFAQSGSLLATPAVSAAAGSLSVSA